MPPDFEIFLVATPGLEAVLLDEVRAADFRDAKAVSGGVVFRGGWPEVWRANLTLRGAGRVLARLGEFPVVHLSQLDKRARKFPWGDFLRRDVAVHIEATCRKSKIYHAGAAAQRIATAIQEFGAPIREDAEVVIKARIEHDLCVISVDTSGDMLHKRGHKEAIAKAPLRETIASLLLRAAGFTGTEPVLDPMCGSGTFVIEAAEMALGLMPGRTRRFAFEQLAGFEAEVWSKMLAVKPTASTSLHFYGSDRDSGAVKAAIANAERAGVSAVTSFTRQSISDLKAPAGQPGLVMVNPPYGTRIGDKRPLLSLHAAFGAVMRERFQGWRVAMITTDAALANATGLPFAKTGAPINHGGLRINLYVTPALR